MVQWCSVETVGMTKPDQQLISLAYLFHIKVASYFQFVGPIKFQMIELQRCWNDTSHFISLVWGIMSGIRFPSVPRPMLPVKPSASCHRVIFTDTGYLRSSIQLILTFIYNVRHNLIWFRWLYYVNAHSSFNATRDLNCFFKTSIQMKYIF